MTRMPLLRDAGATRCRASAAVEAAAVRRGDGREIGALLLFHYPSIWNHVLGDHAVSFRVLPIGPKQTQLTTKWLVHKDAVEGVDYSTRRTDQGLDRDQQSGPENRRGEPGRRPRPAFEPGPYAPIHEGGVMQFVEWYVRTIEPRLAVELRTPLSLAS